MVIIIIIVITTCPQKLTYYVLPNVLPCLVLSSAVLAPTVGRFMDDSVPKFSQVAHLT